METTLYDKDGNPVAYMLDDSHQHIYLWDGRAVAYLHKDKVYGFNGLHLGWFIKGRVYDSVGKRIGFTETTCPSIKKIKPIKSIKEIKKIKSIKNIGNIKPILNISNSSQSFVKFLEKGY